MGVPTSEVGYTPAMPRRKKYEVQKDMWWYWTKKKTHFKPEDIKVKLFLCQMLSDIRKHFVLVEGPRLSSVYTSGRRNVGTKMITGRCVMILTDGRILGEKNLRHCHFLNHKIHTDWVY